MPNYGRRYYGKGGTRKKPQEDGYTFDSKAEYARYRELRLMEHAGAISALSVHPRFALVVNGIPVGRYTADFQYVERSTKLTVTEDVKGFRVSKKTGKKLAVRSRGESMAKKLVKALYGVEIQEVLR